MPQKQIKIETISSCINYSMRNNIAIIRQHIKRYTQSTIAQRTVLKTKNISNITYRIAMLKYAPQSRITHFIFNQRKCIVQNNHAILKLLTSKKRKELVLTVCIKAKAEA